MNQELYNLISLDIPAALTATFAALACGILGNFLVLRKMSLMGDAISHSVLPGIVIAFLITGSRASLPIFIGACIAGITTVILIELVRKLGRLESGAAMGVIFSLLFALGVLLMEQAAARSVDLDADCLLHGQLERVFWFPPRQWNEFLSTNVLLTVPRELVTTFGVFLVAVAFVSIFYKELKLSSFDADLFNSLGFNANLMHYLLMILIAAAVVASFEAVGSILVIAMIICPAATARLLTDRLLVQISLSALIAIVTSILGYTLAAFGPFWFGFSHSLNAAGMMTVVSGITLTTTVIASPSHGIIAKKLRQLRLSIHVAREDMLGILYRIEELGEKDLTLSPSKLMESVGGGSVARIAFQVGLRARQLTRCNDTVKLTNIGQTYAKRLVRTHRLWESFLVEKVKIRPDHVHQTATELEHFTTRPMATRLANVQQHPTRDPHDRPIPKVDDEDQEGDDNKN